MPADANPTAVVRGGDRNSAQMETCCAWGSFVSPTESAYLCWSALHHLARNCILVPFCFFVVLGIFLYCVLAIVAVCGVAVEEVSPESQFK